MTGKSLWIVMVVVPMVGCGACSAKSETGAPAGKSPAGAAAHSHVGQQSATGLQSSEKTSTGSSHQAKVPGPRKDSPDGPTDDFGLPLVIHLDVPETPPEIQRPSPPIKEEVPKPSKH